MELISSFAKLLTKIETNSVLVSICSQNSPIMYNAAHFAFGSVNEDINSIFIVLINLEALSLYIMASGILVL